MTHTPGDKLRADGRRTLQDMWAAREDLQAPMAHPVSHKEPKDRKGLNPSASHSWEAAPQAFAEHGGRVCASATLTSVTGQGSG